MSIIYSYNENSGTEVFIFDIRISMKYVLRFLFQIEMFYVCNSYLSMNTWITKNWFVQCQYFTFFEKLTVAMEFIENCNNYLSDTIL